MYIFNFTDALCLPPSIYHRGQKRQYYIKICLVCEYTSLSVILSLHCMFFMLLLVWRIYIGVTIHLLVLIIHNNIFSVYIFIYEDTKPKKKKNNSMISRVNDFNYMHKSSYIYQILLMNSALVKYNLWCTCNISYYQWTGEVTWLTYLSL